MRSALLTGTREVDVVEREIPPPRPNQVKIQVEQCGLCASEVDLWLGKEPDKFPAEIGHEIAGYVETVGSDVTDLTVGDRVTAWIKGSGFAEFVLAEQQHCVPIAPGVAYPAVAEPLACVVNAVELARPALGDDVVIVGAGYMGTLVQMVTALKGPRSITVVDTRRDALDRAHALGATAVVQVTDNTWNEVLDLV
ncbi:MAG: alcohol dehydrogenase catalytic domain-containing protein, partial [Acidimicrobiia bacterium]